VTFSEWLKLREVGTGSNSIAVFASPLRTRKWPSLIATGPEPEDQKLMLVKKQKKAGKSCYNELDVILGL
jgi:hypothetical protein